MNPCGIVVEVRGLPRPAGSKRVFMVGKGAARRPVVTDDCTAGRDWRASVQDAIARAYNGPPLTGPLALDLVFTMPRPRGHFTRRGTLRPSAPECPTTRPDRSKLCRAVEDAATGLLWRDDSQIVRGSITKVYGERIGVVIHCHALETGRTHATDRIRERRERHGAARDAGAAHAARAGAGERD